MKQLVVLLLPLLSFSAIVAQDSTALNKGNRDWSQLNLSNRPKDHFMIQLGYDSWTQKPDSISTTGLPRSINVYLMFDLIFKTAPRFSVGIGAGIGSDNVYFEKTIIDITGRNANRLGFENVADTNHFKKYKLNTAYLEAPVELRFTANPASPNKSWKGAIGVKVGTLLNAHTKAKNLQNKSGDVISTYIAKERSKRYFNSTRFSVTGRVGYGVLSLYASYQVNAFIKEGFGPDIRPLQIGLTISGL